MNGYTTTYVKQSEYKYVSNTIKFCELAEQALFTKLSEYRMDNNREFFNCDVQIITDHIKKVENDFNNLDIISLYNKYEISSVKICAYIIYFTNFIMKNENDFIKLNMVIDYHNIISYKKDNFTSTQIRKEFEQNEKNQLLNGKDIDDTIYNLIESKINTKEKLSLTELSDYKKHIFKIFWDKQMVDKDFIEIYHNKNQQFANLNLILNKNVQKFQKYYNDTIKNKKDYVVMMINILGFNIEDLNKYIPKVDFYKNKEILFTNSEFSKNYDKIRKLFNRPKDLLNKNLSGSFLTKFLNGILYDFGLELICDFKTVREGKKVFRSSKFGIRIMAIYKDLI